mgnify:FL=1
MVEVGEWLAAAESLGGRLEALKDHELEGGVADEDEGGEEAIEERRGA